jgi:hypothetical protein
VGAVGALAIGAVGGVAPAALAASCWRARSAEPLWSPEAMVAATPSGIGPWLPESTVRASASPAAPRWLGASRAAATLAGTGPRPVDRASPVRAWTNSATVRKRSSGFLAIALRTAAAIPGASPTTRCSIRDGLLVHDLEHHLRHRVADERRLAAQELVHDGAEREQVGPLVDQGVLPRRLLRRHVLRRTEQRRVLGLDGGRAAHLGDAEVEHLDLLDVDPADLGRAQEHVVRLEVAVDDAGAVGGGQGAGDLPGDGEHLGHRQRAAPDPLRQGFALEVLQHHVGRAVGQGVEVVDRDDVGVAQLRRDVGLTLEPGQRLVAGDLGVQHLDRHLLAGQAGVAGQEHGPHPAATDQRLDRVGVGDDRPYIDRHPRQ